MVDWALGLLATLGGGAALVAWTRSLAARRHHRTEEASLVCPRSGSPVRCRLIVDERSSEVVEVSRCSREPGGRPTCEQHCVKLMNLGIELMPREPGREPSGRGGQLIELQGKGRSRAGAAGAG